MLDLTTSYRSEIAALQEAYDRDNEGLTADEYFNRYASDESKAYAQKKISEITESWKRGIAL